MIDGFLVAAALTFAASVHCLGMCGGFVLAVGGMPGSGRWRAAGRQTLLQVGKAATYVFLGALAGAFGGAIMRSPLFTWGGRALAVVAGLALFAAGLTLLGLRGGPGGAVARLVAPLGARVTRPLLATRPTGFPLVVGMVVGFIPCPLVYAGLGGAAASGSALHGALILVGVALGTVPALAVAAAIGAAIPTGVRRGLAATAGVLLLAVGGVTIARGAGLHAGHGAHVGHAGSSSTAPGSDDPHAHHHAP